MDLYVCTNPVNYAVALGQARRVPDRRALLLYESRRFKVRPLPGLTQWHLSVSTARVLRAGLALGLRLDTAYLPHPQLNRRVMALAARAKSIAWIDDGLDTLRSVPRNFQPASLPRDTRYLTFSDHAELAPWVAALQVERPAALVDILQGSLRTPQDLSRWASVFVESPGLQPGPLIDALGLDRAAALVIRHPVAAKRAPLPPGVAELSGGDLDTDASLATLRGRDLFFGETMSFFIALATGCARHNRLWLHMDGGRREGLHGVPAALREQALPGVPGWLGRLDPPSA